MKQAMLTTVDNPYNPFINYDEWYAYDSMKGYHSPELLARVVISSDELSELDQHLAIEQAIDEIVAENVSGVFKKVVQEIEDSEFSVEA
ncbi:MAG: hypothetical protein ABWY25_08490 [Paenisporosarcina sp.]